MMDDERTYTAFAGNTLIVASATLRAMLTKARVRAARSPERQILMFEDWSGRQVEFDLRGTFEQVLAHATEDTPQKGPGRPRLGVVSREVTLLPRHWEWLEEQPHGASAALRRLVEGARKLASGKQQARLVRDAVSKIMWALAGDLPNFEEASRALFAKDTTRFARLVHKWPKAMREYLTGRLREAARHEARDASGQPLPGEND